MLLGDPHKKKFDTTLLFTVLLEMLSWSESESCIPNPEFEFTTLLNKLIYEFAERPIPLPELEFAKLKLRIVLFESGPMLKPLFALFVAKLLVKELPTLVKREKPKELESAILLVRELP